VSGSAEIWDEIAPVHEAILEHPFLLGLADGTLPREAFRRYVIQDALFLVDYARALALCAARAEGTADLRMFCRHAADAIDVERDLHDRLLAELGIDPEAAVRAEPSPACLGYTSFLLQACAVRERYVALGALLPCYWIYREVGAALAAADPPEPRYRAWIATYGGEEFAAAAQGVIDACDRAAAGLGPESLGEMRRAALIAARYEWMFWDSAWRGERWGPPAPATTSSPIRTSG
jgi:thiaminase/transcriptional activator TenA